MFVEKQPKLVLFVTAAYSCPLRVITEVSPFTHVALERIIS